MASILVFAVFEYINYYFLTYIVIWSVLIPIAVGSAGYKKKPAASKAIYHFLLYSGICDVIVNVCVELRLNTTSGLHFYTVGEFIILSLFFKQLFADNKTTLMLYWGMGIFVFLAIINLLFFQNINTMSTYTRTLEALVMIGYSFVYFERQSRIRQPMRWEKRPNNWFVTGVLFYFAGAFFFFLFSNAISTLPNITQLIIWNIHGFCQITMYVLIAIGYRHERRNG